jgi:hypothetical protein
MVMAPAEVEDYCKKHPNTGALLVLEDAGKCTRLRYGKW